MILACSCAYPYQDESYGQGNRVFNLCKPKVAEIWVRCTVCGQEKVIGSKKKADKRESGNKAESPAVRKTI